MPGSKVFLHTYSYACGSLFLGCPYSVKNKKESFPKEAITILCLEGAKKKMDLFATEPDRASTSLTLEGNTALKLHLATR